VGSGFTDTISASRVDCCTKRWAIWLTSVGLLSVLRFARFVDFAEFFFIVQA
jgi:hypothetical protein